MPALEHFPSTEEISFVVAHDGATLHGCLPVRRLDRWSDSLPVLTTQLWDMAQPPAAPGGPPLIDPECAGDTLHALLRALAAERRRGLPGVVVLERLLEDGPVAAQVSAEASALRQPVQVGATWHRALHQAGGGDWTKSFTPGILKKVRRRRRRLVEQMGDEVRLVDRSADRGAVEDLLTMEAAGWKGRAETAVFIPPLAVHFRDICARFWAEGRLNMLSLESAGECLAMRISVQAGSDYFTLRKAYDEKYASFGPGVLMDVEFIKYMTGRADVRRVHLMHGPSYQEHNARIFSTSVAVCTMVLATGGFFDRAHVRGAHAVGRVKGLARRARLLATD